ncbi:MAG: transporter substrate-binding domain-containing protein [Myxococcota bacterium]|nr:transporter substrate-binding domain-containing protein [Myxococcota bacterium]
MHTEASAAGPERRARARRVAVVLLALVPVWGCGDEPASTPSPPEAPPVVEESAPPPVLPVLPAHLSERFTGDLAEMRERKVVRALVSWSRTDFAVVHGRPRGIQAELLQQLETHLNQGSSRKAPRVRVAFVPVPFEDLIPALLEGRGDLAAAFLTATPEREKQVDFASGRGLAVNEIVVARRGGDVPRSVDDLAGRRVQVMRGSSYAENLRAQSRRLVARGLAPIDVQEADPRFVTEDILELVNAGQIDLTVADDFRAELWARVMPNLVLLPELVVHEGGHVGWATRPGSPELHAALKSFMKKVRKGSLIGNVLFARYYEDVDWIRNPLDETETDKVEHYAPLFRKYADRYGFDWRALVAQSYQESGLDHDRRSRAGAIGLMQLLPSTAADPKVGLPDVHDEEENVHAGTRYLAFLRDRYFSGPEIPDEERLAFAWAAYNAGPAKLRKVRSRAEAMGLDPNRWFGHCEHAALAVVGREPVRYVANITKYYVAYQLAAALRGGMWLADIP